MSGSEYGSGGGGGGGSGGGGGVGSGGGGGSGGSSETGGGSAGSSRASAGRYGSGGWWSRGQGRSPGGRSSINRAVIGALEGIVRRNEEYNSSRSPSPSPWKSSASPSPSPSSLSPSSSDDQAPKRQKEVAIGKDAGTSSRPAALPRKNFIDLPIRPGEVTCKEYFRWAMCSKGDTCEFNHPEPKLVKRKNREKTEPERGKNREKTRVVKPLGFKDPDSDI